MSEESEKEKGSNVMSGLSLGLAARAGVARRQWYCPGEEKQNHIAATMYKTSL